MAERVGKNDHYHGAESCAADCSLGNGIAWSQAAGSVLFDVTGYSISGYTLHTDSVLNRQDPDVADIVDYVAGVWR